MNLLYVTQNYESVQKHLYESLKSVVTNVYLAHYHLVDSNTEEQFPDGVTYITSKIKVKGFLFYTLKLWRIYDKCKRQFADTQLDIIHGNMLFCDGYICRKLSKKKNIPYCVSVRNTDINSRFLWNIPWTRIIGLKNIIDASAIIFLSKTYQDKLIAKVPQEYRKIIAKKSYILANGIDDYYIENSIYKEKCNDMTIRLIFVGRISKCKNLEATIKACKILISSGKSVVLNVVGPIVDNEYRKMIDESSFIIYHGECNKQQVLKHLRDSDIFVMPSHTETFGLVYLEAMTQGLPVIYTRGQGFDGQYKEGTVGYSVDENNSDEIAEKILRIIDNYTTLSQNATEISRECGWDKISERFASVFRDVLKK